VNAATIGLAVAIVALVLIPLFRPVKTRTYAYASIQEWEKQNLFAQLADIEYDLHMGKVTEEDYRLAKQELNQQIARLMQQDEAMRREIKEEIEANISRKMAEMDGGGEGRT
jgi:cytochrome c-type biogenesis protein CcmI